MYLFHSATLTGGGAGTDRRRRTTFSLDSGAYTATYKMGTGSLSPNNTWGFNPEHSTVVTPSYREALGDRWLNNGLAFTQSGATGANVLDRTHYYATVVGCARIEDTFDGGASNPGEGAFVVNIARPGARDPLLPRRQQLQVHREHRLLLPRPRGHALPNCAAMPASPATAAPTTS